MSMTSRAKFANSSSWRDGMARAYERRVTASGPGRGGAVLLSTSVETVCRGLLAAMADLAPAGRATVPLQVAGRDDFLWLGTLHSLFAHVGAKKQLLLSTPKTHRLAQLDAMHREDHILREGWVFLVGTIERDGNAGFRAPPAPVETGAAPEVVAVRGECRATGLRRSPARPPR